MRTPWRPGLAGPPAPAPDGGPAARRFPLAGLRALLLSMSLATYLFGPYTRYGCRLFEMGRDAVRRAAVLLDIGRAGRDDAFWIAEIGLYSPKPGDREELLRLLEISVRSARTELEPR